MNPIEPTVFVVDDDASVLKGLRLLLKSVNLNAETYLSAQEFIDAYDPSNPGCLVLDIRMPGMSGLELQQLLRNRGIMIPVIFISGHGDVPVAVKAMKDGAVDFLEKPFSDQALLDQIQNAIIKDLRNRTELADHQELTKQFKTLTPRENDVLKLVVAGKANKVVAYELGCSPKTVEFHRANIMKKMKVDSLAELVSIYMKANQQS